MSTKLFYLLGLIIGVIILIVIASPSSQARLIACDVGQGDAILITKGSNQALIDGGPSTDKILSCLQKYMPFWDRRIELIVLTNSDADHAAGLISVIERYQLIRFVTADGVHASDKLEQLLSVVHARGIEIQGVEQGENINIGRRESLSFRVLWPPYLEDKYMAVYSANLTDLERSQILGASAKRGNLNERSVVLEWDENGYKTLLMGDAGDQAEKELIQQNLLQDIDLLKVGHHGSKYASTTEFLARIKPEVAIISVGAKNRYGHPTQETLERLSKIGSVVHRTDQEGDLVIPILSR